GEAHRTGIYKPQRQRLGHWGPYFSLTLPKHGAERSLKRARRFRRRGNATHFLASGRGLIDFALSPFTAQNFPVFLARYKADPFLEEFQETHLAGFALNSVSLFARSFRDNFHRRFDLSRLASSASVSHEGQAEIEILEPCHETRGALGVRGTFAEKEQEPILSTEATHRAGF
ncbi:hypothetical protein TNIN_289041, partial [Trichonephila inaurata madagascariensis]